MGCGAVFPLAVHGPRGRLPAQFDAGHCEVCACLLPEGAHQWGDLDFKCPPRGPIPFLPSCGLTYSLQGTGVGHEPLSLCYTPCHFFRSNELSDVEDGWGRWASILPTHPHTPPPHCEQVLGQLQSGAFCPQHQQGDQFAPGHFFFSDALDCHLEPAGCPPMRVYGFECLRLLLTNIHLVIRLPAGTFLGLFHPLCSQFSAATSITLDYAAHRCMRGLQIVLPCILLVQGGPSHSSARTAGPGIGWHVDSRGQFGHGVGTRVRGFPAVTPQQHAGC